MPPYGGCLALLHKVTAVLPLVCFPPISRLPQQHLGERQGRKGCLMVWYAASCDPGEVVLHPSF